MRRRHRILPASAPTSLPDPFYYLRNFERVLSSLQRRYAPLFAPNEQLFFDQFGVLPEASQALLVRMIMRQGMLFRESHLAYPEIGAMEAALAPLLEAGLIEEPSLTVDEQYQVSTKLELVHQLGLSTPCCRLTKTDLLPMLRENQVQPSLFEDWQPRVPDRVFRPVVKPLAERLRGLFFGNFHQDWTTFVLTDLGKRVYEAVPLHSVPFSTREQVEAFWQMMECQRRLALCHPTAEIIARLPAPILDSDWLEELRQELVFAIASGCAKKDAATALGLFAACRHRGSRSRTLRLLERRGAWQGAWDLCQLALESPESDVEKQYMRRVLPRINRHLNRSSNATSTKIPIPTAELHIEPSPKGRSLEWHMRDHLARDAESVVAYVENNLIKTLFGLLCWDAIFAPVPGAFFHDYQRGPADLSSPHFFQRRRREFDQCFGELDSGRYRDTILKRYPGKLGIQSPLVNRRRLSMSLIECALTCFPPEHLRLWFQWIARDVVENCSGFPDLVQFWPAQRRYRLVEIKGPGDRLQRNQQRLVEFCVEHRMPVTVLRVRWSDAGGPCRRPPELV